MLWEDGSCTRGESLTPDWRGLKQSTQQNHLITVHFAPLLEQETIRREHNMGEGESKQHYRITELNNILSCISEGGLQGS